jgi:hypothetical protein
VEGAVKTLAEGLPGAVPAAGEAGEPLRG